jgi:transposase
VTETLEVVPRQWKVIQTVRERFSCRQCETISQPPAPFHVTPRGFAGPNLLAMILFEKFGQHQPLNRQSERYAREGINLSLSTLADQVGACATALRPLHALIEGHVLAAERLHGDDTTVPFSPRVRPRPGGSGYTSATTSRSADRTRRRRCSTPRAIAPVSIPNAIWRAGAASCKPTLTAATTACISPTASRNRSSKRCAGAMRGASSSNWPTSPLMRGAARTPRRSRRSPWRRSGVSTPSSTSSATSTASGPTSVCASGAKSSPIWSRS